MRKSNRNHLAFYDISSRAAYVKTFEGKKYKVRGLWVIDQEGAAEKLSAIYYRIRTVKDIGFKTIAKRKNPNCELKFVN
jgi:hypothetical protein